MRFACVNDRFIPETEAAISVFDRGFLHGDALFETMRVYDGKVFLLEEHLQRLGASLSALEIPASPPPTALIEELIQRNAIRDGVVRLTVSRGDEHPTTVITARPRTFDEPSRPWRAILSSYRVHPQLARFKTASRLPYVLAKREAQRQGADEALLLNPYGQIAEFSAANIFLVRDGTLWTPPVEDGALPGITRAAVLELAKQLGIPTREQSLAAELLESAEEVFATNSLIEVVRVTSWGRRDEITSELQRRYHALAAQK